jgi:hypothetical protein
MALFGGNILPFFALFVGNILPFWKYFTDIWGCYGKSG